MRVARTGLVRRSPYVATEDFQSLANQSKCSIVSQPEAGLSTYQTYAYVSAHVLVCSSGFPMTGPGNIARMENLVDRLFLGTCSFEIELVDF